MLSGQLENNSHAVDELFEGGILKAWYGQEVKAMTEYVREHAKLNEKTDAPLPPWAVHLLAECAELGPKHRVRLALLHHQIITGDKIKAGILKDSDRKVKAAEELISSGKRKLRSVPKPAFFKRRKTESAQEGEGGGKPSPGEDGWADV